MVCAIALHNIPEGMTIGASASIANDALTGSALVMAVLIGLHNICLLYTSPSPRDA